MNLNEKGIKHLDFINDYFNEKEIKVGDRVNILVSLTAALIVYSVDENDPQKCLEDTARLLEIYGKMYLEQKDCNCE